VKHDSDPEAVARLLGDQLTELSLNATTAQLGTLVEYVQWAGRAAARLGLTQYRAPTEFARGLVLPTLSLFLPPMQEYLRGPLLDFGAGSGALGLTVAILRPDIEIVLADRRRRVIDFLDLCRARYGLTNCRTLLADLDAGPSPGPGAYHLVLVRAYGPADHALKRATAWLAPSGAIALWHQPPVPSLPHHLYCVASVPTSLSALCLSMCRRNTV